LKDDLHDRSKNLVPVIQATEESFTQAIHALESDNDTQVSAKPLFENMNDDAERLLEKRREELGRGELETDTKKQLVEVKSVVDQFNHIYNIALDIEKITHPLPPSLPDGKEGE